MSSEVESGRKAAKQDAVEDSPGETLNDLMDRMGREAFHRSLDRRSLRRPNAIDYATEPSE